MLEAATQAAAWLMHHRTRFAKSMAVLKESRNIRYGNFVAPGNFLRMEVELNKTTPGVATFKATGYVGDATAVSGRIELAYFNLKDHQPELASLDERLTAHNRSRWNLIAPANYTDTVLT